MAGNVDGACYVHAVRQTRPLTRTYEHTGEYEYGPVSAPPLCVLACSLACDVVSGVAARGGASRIVEYDASRDAKMFAPFVFALAVSREVAHMGRE